MSIDPTLRGQADQEPILDSIVARLIDRIPEFNDQNCWLSDQAIPLTMPGGRIACTVSPGPGRFPSEFFAGAGHETLVEDGSVVITPILMINLDRPRRARRRLIEHEDQTKGLIFYKKAILAALFAHSDWEPHEGRQPLLRDMLSPIRCDAPTDVVVGEAQGLAMKINISTVFDWNLS